MLHCLTLVLWQCAHIWVHAFILICWQTQGRAHGCKFSTSRVMDGNVGTNWCRLQAKRQQRTGNSFTHATVSIFSISMQYFSQTFAAFLSLLSMHCHSLPCTWWKGEECRKRSRKNCIEREEIRTLEWEDLKYVVAFMLFFTSVCSIVALSYSR